MPTSQAGSAFPPHTGDLWLPDLMSKNPASGVRPAQFGFEDEPGGSAFNLNVGPAQTTGPLLPQLPSSELASNIPQLPNVGYAPVMPQTPMLGGCPTPPLPYPGYAMTAPALPVPPGYLPPPPQQHPCFPTHPYARSPRDFFMWRENMEDRVQRRQPIPLR